MLSEKAARGLVVILGTAVVLGTAPPLYAQKTAPPPKPQSSARPAAPAPPAAAPASRTPEQRLRAQIAAWAKVPYKDDGTSRSGIGNDGFVKVVFKNVYGIDIPAKLDDQIDTGKLVERKALQPGDLLFFEGKGVGPFRSKTVGIFLGRGEFALAHKELGVATVKLSDSRWNGSFKTARRISTPPTSDAPVFNAADYGSNRAALLRDIAKAWSGTLYKQGGTTFEGIGNDEFVREIYEAINDDELEGTPGDWAHMGRAVKKTALQPGDIILYEAVGIGKLVNRRHAGMYIGNGEFVHAVKGAAVTISKVNDPRWSDAFRAARRINPPGAPAPPALAKAALPPATPSISPASKGPATVPQSGAAAAPRASVASKAPATLPPSAGGGAVLVGAPRDLSEQERRLRQAADAWRGTPYKIGGTTKAGIDCSAFVRALYVDAFGTELPRTAEEQERLGTKIDRQHLQTGDLVFFRTQGMGPFFKSRHVGIYLGSGEFAQASGSLGVNVSTLSNRYWSKKYESARRLRTTTTN